MRWAMDVTGADMPLSGNSTIVIRLRKKTFGVGAHGVMLRTVSAFERRRLAVLANDKPVAISMRLRE